MGRDEEDEKVVDNQSTNNEHTVIKIYRFEEINSCFFLNLIIQ